MDLKPAYIIVKKNAKNPADTKYFPRATSYGIVEMKGLCAEIVETTGLSRGDVTSALDAFYNVLMRHIKQGQWVRFYDMGYFYLSFSSKAEDNPGKISADSIKDIRLKFRASPELRNAIRDLTVEPYQNKGYDPNATTTPNLGN